VELLLLQKEKNIGKRQLLKNVTPPPQNIFIYRH